MKQIENKEIKGIPIYCSVFFQVGPYIWPLWGAQDIPRKPPVKISSIAALTSYWSGWKLIGHNWQDKWGQYRKEATLGWGRVSHSQKMVEKYRHFYYHHRHHSDLGNIYPEIARAYSDSAFRDHSCYVSRDIFQESSLGQPHVRQEP